MNVDPDSTIPIYQQIADQVRSAIAAGVYRPGEMIPSVRTLALELLINPNTVQRSFEALEREGLIHSRKGRGMFVSDRSAPLARRRTREAIRRAFAHGIQLGQSAGLDEQGIDQVYDEASRGRRSSSKRTSR